MEFMSASLTELVLFLMPGFLAAWILYGTTSHPKPSQFERIIQALILTFLIKGLVSLIEVAFVLLGKVHAVGEWTDSSEIIVSSIVSVLLGLFLASCVNKDVVHKYLRKIGFTTRTSHPSEWFYILSEKVTFVVLHLVDGRRIYGWPKEWPIERGKGQFYIMEPVWLPVNDEGEAVENHDVDGILIDSNDVQFIEFMKVQEEYLNE